MRLWNVDIAGRCGIALRPNEPFGGAFVYGRTCRRAEEVFNRRISSDYSTPDDSCVYIPRSCTVKQARELRALVLADVEERQRRLNAVKDALDDIDHAQATLMCVKGILEAQA